jgi:2-iminoacetate synthase
MSKSRFSTYWKEHHAEFARIAAGVCAPERVEELLAKSPRERLELTELAELLAAGPDGFEAMRSFVLSLYRPAASQVRYVAPIYLSSYCIDTCAYCNFSGERKGLARRRLSVEDLEGELANVLAAGARVVELVLATDPELSWRALVPYVERTAALLDGEPGSGVLLGSEHLPSEAYTALRDAGLWGIVQWDETLDAVAFRRWHSTSPRKRDFETRMDNHDRAMAAGLEVATGALFGLADWRYDTLMQIAKVRYLEAEYGRKPFVFGTPRLKPIGGRELHPATEVSDRAYETALMVYQIAEPAIGRWLQTRETFELNLRNLLDGDVFTYRCGEVVPGGYRDAAGAGQFGVHEVSRDTVERELAALGFQVEYSWVGRMRGESPCKQVPRVQRSGR